MKQNLLFKTALLLVALFGGVSASWAEDNPISIPQDMGDHIVLGDNSSNFASYVTTHTGCTLDNRLKKSDTEYVTVGTSKDGATLTLNVTATTAGDYVFGFKTGSDNGTSTVAISMLKSGESTPQNIATSEDVIQDGNWDPNVVHNFYVGALEKDENCTITLTITNTGGGYSGNFGLFYFHTVSQYPAWPTDGSTTIDLSGGTYYNSKYNSDDVISGLDNGGYMDNILLNNSTEGYYTLKFNVQDYKADGTLTATIYNMATGEAEITTEALSITSTGDKTIHLGKSLTTGLKRLRFDFTGTKTNGTIFNYKDVTFQLNSYDALPMYGTAVLDLSMGSMTSGSNPRYSSSSGTNNEISYIYNGGYADDFYVVISGNETAYYDLRTTTSNYNNHEGTFKVTITDMATNTVEVNAQESATITSNGQSIVMPLTVALKPGLKKIRLDFVKDGEREWLYNIKDICFYKRSLNEGYDYTPVAATDVDVVLTRSITAGNWSTICLPFDMTKDQVKATFGDDTQIAAIGEYNSSTKVLSTTSASTITANVPCLIKVTSNFTSKTIEGVTIQTGTPEKVIDGDFKLVGVYASTKLPEGSYFVSGNKLYKATAKTNAMKPFRAYFDSVPAGARLAFFDEETTSIEDVRSKMEDVRCEYFDLQGRRVAQPTKGLYIVNGKKVVVK